MLWRLTLTLNCDTCVQWKDTCLYAYRSAVNRSFGLRSKMIRGISKKRTWCATFASIYGRHALGPKRQLPVGRVVRPSLPSRNNVTGYDQSVNVSYVQPNNSLPTYFGIAFWGNFQPPFRLTAEKDSKEVHHHHLPESRTLRHASSQSSFLLGAEVAWCALNWWRVWGHHSTHCNIHDKPICSLKQGFWPLKGHYLISYSWSGAGHTSLERSEVWSTYCITA